MISSRNYIITLCICCVVGGCYLPPTEQEIQSADYGAESGGITQEVAESLARILHGARLKDPDSAKYKFSNLYKGFIYEGNKIEFGYFLDVYINAKNSFGGYTGYKRYRNLYRDGELIGYCVSGESVEVCGLLDK